MSIRERSGVTEAGVRRFQVHSSGFIVTLELLLIFTILVIGSFAGCAWLRNELVQLRVNKDFSGVILRDASPDGGGFDDAFGKPVSYDLCEAPEILCQDLGFSTGVTTAGDTEGLFALVGVRATHFVSRNRVYFSGAGCTGTAYLATPNNSELPIGYFNCGLQVDDADVRVCYGVGPPSNYPCSLGVDCADGGRLYRSDGISTTTFAAATLYQWTSLYPDCEGLPPAFDATDFCEAISFTGTLANAAEVTRSDGATNVLAGPLPPFEVLPQPDLTLTTTPASPETPGTDTGGGTITGPPATPEGT